MPQLSKVGGFLADGLEKDAQIFGKSAQQAFRPLGQMARHAPLRQPFRHVWKLVDVDPQSYTVIFRAGVILVIDGVFRTVAGNFIRETGQQVLPPEFIHGFLRRNMQGFRVVFFHACGPPQKGLRRAAVLRNKAIEELKNAFLAPDLVRAA